MKYTSKTDNTRAALPAKLELRRKLIAEVARPARVFDAFAGEGVLYHAVWHEADSYVGCDEKWFRDERTVFVGDNRRVLRAIDLSAFNLFDLDAYGCPWEQAMIIAARRPIAPGERIGLAITDGLGLFYKMNGIPGNVAQLAGLRRDSMVGVIRVQDMILDRCIIGLMQRTKARVVKQWRAAGANTTAMRYLGLVLEGLPGQPSHRRRDQHQQDAREQEAATLH